MINTIEMLNQAKKEQYAIPQFNINNLEWTKYILEECQSLNSEVILGVSEGAIKYMGGYNVVYNLVNSLIKDLKITIKVALHLDHGTSFDSCKKAIDAGFTSVMIDASKYELEDNIKITKEVVEYAHKNNVSVEAEIGHIGGTEDNITAEIIYAKTEDCLKLFEQTNIDSIAPALGSVHGFYKEKANLQFDKMKEINNKLIIPLVLHGGTGIDDESIKKAIKSGISKININTELQYAWSTEIKKYLKENENIYDPRKIISSGENALKKIVKEKITLFKNN